MGFFERKIWRWFDMKFDENFSDEEFIWQLIKALLKSDYGIFIENKENIENLKASLDHFENYAHFGSRPYIADFEVLAYKIYLKILCYVAEKGREMIKEGKSIKKVKSFINTKMLLKGYKNLQDYLSKNKEDL